MGLLQWHKVYKLGEDALHISPCWPEYPVLMYLDLWTHCMINIFQFSERSWGYIITTGLLVTTLAVVGLIWTSMFLCCK